MLTPGETAAQTPAPLPASDAMIAYIIRHRHHYDHTLRVAIYNLVRKDVDAPLDGESDEPCRSSPDLAGSPRGSPPPPLRRAAVPSGPTREIDIDLVIVQERSPETLLQVYNMARARIEMLDRPA